MQTKLLDEAKTRIFDSEKTITLVASSLGFKYQQQFTRFFKQRTGMTPDEFRNSIN
ncbi:MAG TPA: helix-turn-helix domain-containing protein [Chitinophagaceae bacterium]|nr:helix-turn-helix domain-containing protein [Chitinophagaceae bacterium]